MPFRHFRNHLFVLFIGILLGMGSTALVAEVGGSAYFSDVPPGAYFSDAVRQLYEANIMRGVDGKFRPDGLVTRSELAVVAQRLRDEFRGVRPLGRRIDTGATSSSSSISSASSVSSSSSVQSSSASSASSSSSSSAARRSSGPSVRFTIGKYSVRENASGAVISVIRIGGNEGTASIDYALVSGTAVAGEDFVAATGTLSFANRETSKTFRVQITNDTKEEGSETVTIELKNPTGVSLGFPSTAILTITDDEGAAVQSPTTPTASASTAFVFSAYAYEVAENRGPVTVTVVRTGPTSGGVSVDYATTNGTAKPSDYTPASGTLSFASGETAKTFTVSVNDDASIEGNKTVNLLLKNPTGGAVLGSPSSTMLTITDNEVMTFGTGAFKFSTERYEVVEGSGVATALVQRVNGTYGAVTVQYATNNGSARAPEDYTATAGTLTFLAGEAKKAFTVPIARDEVVDPEESINLLLSSPTGGATLTTPNSALMTIFE